jgi:AraC-like DNA-binding protein
VERFAVQTRDPELAHELISEIYGVHRALLSGSCADFRFSLSSASVGSIACDVMTHSVSTRVVMEPLRHLTTAYLTDGRVVVGRGRTQQCFRPGDVVLYPYGAGFEARWSTIDQGLLRIDFGSVAKLAAATTDSDPATFRFLGMRPVSPAMGQYWRTLMVYLDGELATAQPAIGEPLVLAQTEAMLAAAALAVFPNTSLVSVSRPRFGRVGPSALRRAVAFIDAHADEAVTLADIAAGAGVGARALQLSFAGHYGSTPMGYLRRVRLDRAHCELQAANPARGDTVGHIARRWGFAQRSRFAASYRRAYGVSPSHTLRT